MVLALTVALCAVFAGTAYAGLDDEPADGIHGTTTSNPGWGPDHWWRQGWGRSMEPDFRLFPPEAMDSDFDGWIMMTLYTVDRTPSACATGAAATAIIDTATPEAYYRSSIGGTTDNTGPYGSNQNYTLDMLGIYANPPLGGWPAPDPAAAAPWEGRWYYHYRFYSNFRPSNTVHTVGFGIDTTPPNPVTGLTLRTGLTTPPVVDWQPHKRVHITWDPAIYDALSGDGYYEVRIDDKAIIPEASTTPVQGRVYSAPWLPTPSSITVEDMPPGKHKVSIVVVDRATNESTATSAYYYSDPDTPTVSITNPLNGLLKETTYISADASDLAGPPTVVFSLDGASIATFTAPPYRFKPDLTGVTPGNHLLTAVATDHLGRTATDTMTVSTSGPTVIPNDGFIPTDDESLNSTMTATTLTHPLDEEDETVFWRQGWGNSLWPQFQITPPTPAAIEFGFVSGMLYTVDRTETTTIDPTDPKSYYVASRGDGANLEHTLDFMGNYSYPPTGGWPDSTLGGEIQPYEGYWYFHFKPFTSKGYVPLGTSFIKFGVDVTKPRAVTGLLASPSLDESLAGTWTESSRAHLSWDADRYDDLSGVAYYKILLDGVPVIPSESDNAQGRVYEVVGRTPGSVTIENMPSGRHRLSVIPVDRATNEGPATSTYFYSDPDTPTIAFGDFSRTCSTRPTFSVVTSDAAGIANVVYRLDGNLLGTQTSSPFSISPDLSGYAEGPHTLMATATDMLGRSVSVSTTITLDKTPLVISSFTRTPSLFYPILRDGYKDNMAVRFKVNKPCTVTLYVKTSKGTTVRTLSKSCTPGSTMKIVWNGKWSKDGKAHTGTFKLKLSGTDNVGYTDSTGTLSVKIRDYQLVRTSSNTIKVVKR